MKKLFILLALSGCIGATGPEETHKQTQTLEYYKDMRTNLCFVRNSVTDSNGFSENIFSNVPCTPEVEKLVVRGP
jgi:hypothetical protein